MTATAQLAFAQVATVFTMCAGHALGTYSAASEICGGSGGCERMSTEGLPRIGMRNMATQWLDFLVARLTQNGNSSALSTAPPQYGKLSKLIYIQPSMQELSDMTEEFATGCAHVERGCEGSCTASVVGARQRTSGGSVECPTIWEL